MSKPKEKTAGEKLLDESRRLYKPQGSGPLDEAVGIAPIYQNYQKQFAQDVQVIKSIMNNPDAWSKGSVDAVTVGIKNYGERANKGLADIDKVVAQYPTLGPELKNVLLGYSNNVADLETRKLVWLNFVAQYSADIAVDSEMQEAAAKKDKDNFGGLATYAKDKLTETGA